MELSEEEKKAIETLETEGTENNYLEVKILLNLVEKQQKEIEDYRKFKKDIVSKIMIWEKEELPDNETIVEMIDTLMSEVSRLEDIEDKKVQVAVDLIEAKRDKFWKGKIKNKIEQLELFKKALPIRGTEIERFIGELKELLEEE